MQKHLIDDRAGQTKGCDDKATLKRRQNDVETTLKREQADEYERKQKPFPMLKNWFDLSKWKSKNVLQNVSHTYPSFDIKEMVGRKIIYE